MVAVSHCSREIWLSLYVPGCLLVCAFMGRVEPSLREPSGYVEMGSQFNVERKRNKKSLLCKLGPADKDKASSEWPWSVSTQEKYPVCGHLPAVPETNQNEEVGRTQLACSEGKVDTCSLPLLVFPLPHATRILNLSTFFLHVGYGSIWVSRYCQFVTVGLALSSLSILV